ncbi:class I SAM-dependent methyltransferase [Niabella insulamsoli]|uniref:class I SAM-dependent methyltransferase n=1 Tax=Niabella insulamsoli TaxID=3144874 RepID=UPI0031FCEBBA
MKCSICQNEADNRKILLKEMMFGFRDTFEYFECNHCACIQILEIPKDLAKYYPSNYYSYQAAEVPVKRSIIRRIHYNFHAFGRNKLPGSLLALKFKPPLFYNWLKELQAGDPNESILDIGCGNGQLLKRIYRLGFNDLTGIDPFLDRDISYNASLRLLKKDIFEVDGKFDIIMMHHSLEHMDEQNAVIQKASSLLTDGGRMLIRIPIVSRPLMEKYGENVASLDPPRHLFIHSLTSILKLLEDNALTVYKTIYDAELFSILGSEQYAMGISNVNDDRSYIQNPAGSSFTQEDLNRFELQINALNKKGESDSIALYIKK